MKYRLGVLTSHPIQYQAPLFRELARVVDLHVFFAHQQSADDHADAGFGVPFEWDIDLLEGYRYTFLPNVAKKPGVNHFVGCDTPAIKSEIKHGNFDAFMVTGWYLKCYWQAVMACRKHKIPVMVRGDSQLGTPRSYIKSLVKEVVFPVLLGYFDAFLYVGQRNREYLEHYGVPPEKLFFSPHFIDNEYFAERARQADVQRIRKGFGCDKNERLVLFVGKLIPKKRPMDFVKALKLLGDKGLQVCGVIVGSGELEQELRHTAERMGVKLTFAGFRNQSELPAIYKAADLLVLPSDAGETWGLVINEAMACGTPVVASTAIGCMPDLIDEGLTGRSFPVGDIGEITDAVFAMLGAKKKPACSTALQQKVNHYSVAAAVAGVRNAASYMSENR